MSQDLSSNAYTQSDIAVDLPFKLGDIINNKYQTIQIIGSGGMGYVVSANHIELNEKVALKFLRKEYLSNQELTARFANEARAAVKIKSEFVARVFDVGKLDDGTPFIVMEYLEGKDLYSAIHAQGSIPIKTAVDYIMQACEALATAHAAGIIHRDIKPENLFLTNGHTIKVLDFGISKVALTGSAFESGIPLIKTTAVIGTPVYMSPEQIRASDNVNEKTDIWSLGCVLYELITGNPAFDGPSLMQLSAIILEENPVLDAKIPLDLYTVIMRCLDKEPENRFENIAQLAIALYPFGPSKARISAERCCYLIHGETPQIFSSSGPRPAEIKKSNFIVGGIIVTSILALASLFFINASNKPIVHIVNIPVSASAPIDSAPIVIAAPDASVTEEETPEPVPTIIVPKQRTIIKQRVIISPKNNKQIENVNPEVDVGF